jgi:catechol 2,3-dioxygenase
VSSIHSQTRIGHVHLKVADLDRAIAFYCDVLGFTVTQRMGNSAAFLAAGGYHHHIGLNTWESSGGKPPAQGTTGLYHLAILYPTRAELADALRRLLRAGISLEGAADHGVSHALYLRDPDDNGVELYWDLPAEQWPRTSAGELAMVTRPLDLHALQSEADASETPLGPPDLAELLLSVPASNRISGSGMMFSPYKSQWRGASGADARTSYRPVV